MPANKLRILYIGNKLAAHGRTPTGIDCLGPLLEAEGHTLIYAGTRLQQFARLREMLHAVWRHRRNIDVVLIDTYSTTAFYYAWLCGSLCAMLGIRYIPILHGGNLPRRFKTSPGKCRSLFGNSFTNIVVSGYLQQHLQEAGLKSLVIPNSINIHEYHFRRRQQLQTRLLWVRSFHETYNPAMAIYVLHELREKHPSACLTMIGPEVDGSMEASKTLCTNLGLEDHVTFTGKLTKQEWSSLAQEHDIFINTSNYDNLPVSVLEAMALGLPVVSTNIGGIPHLVKDKQTGMLVEPADVRGMVNTIRELVEGAQLAAKLGTNAREYAESFDWGNVKTKWEKLFNTINRS